MCLITVGKMPKQEILEAAAKTNDDGIGVAWRSSKGVEWVKDLEVKDLLELPTAVKEYCAIHFRWATVGGAVKELIHPFPIERDVRLDRSGRADEVLMHNGHVTDWYDYLSGIKVGDDKVKFDPKGPTSDSRTLAHMVWRFGPDILYLTKGQRIMLWHYKHNPMLYGQWHEEDGTHYSNTTYKVPKVTTYAGDYRRSGTGHGGPFGGGYGGNYGRSFDDSKSNVKVYTKNAQGELEEDKNYWKRKQDEELEKDWLYWEAKWKEGDKEWEGKKEVWEERKKRWKNRKKDSQGNVLKGSGAKDKPSSKDDDTQPLLIPPTNVPVKTMEQEIEEFVGSGMSLVGDVDLRTTEERAENDTLEQEALRLLGDGVPLV